MPTSSIRNFCIIAHVDHGKSTIADRMIEITQTVANRDMKEQLLDQMDIERERGITIKLQPVRMHYKDHILNLIDTPGHVDFSYEVSRSLAAVEGAILLVDASQGIQAQTLTTLYQAMELNLEIIPVINKIDLPHAEPERCAAEVIKLLGCKPEEIVFASGKTGEGVAEILDRVIEVVPPPVSPQPESMRALVFDCIFDSYRGVIAFVRIVDGTLEEHQQLTLIQGRKETESLEVGHFLPARSRSKQLKTGEIGYIVTGLKEVSDIGIGDTFTLKSNILPAALPGYKIVNPMVFASLFPTEGDEYPALRDAIGKLKLNDSALTYIAENSPALGFGFRCGFLGMLHLEIVIERLQREYNADVIATVPSVAYEVKTTSGETVEIHNPSELPDITRTAEICEPWVKLEIVTPVTYLGGCMELCQQHRGVYQNTQYLDSERAVLLYEIPLAEIIVNFYDQLKSLSSGYASLSYEWLEFRAGDLVKMDMLVAGEPISALSIITPRSSSLIVGRQMCERLKDLIPRHAFMVAIQAAINGNIVARESISAYRKDVTAKLYGGDVTRKNKLLEKQKQGKKRMKKFGRVDVPNDVFIELLKR